MSLARSAAAATAALLATAALAAPPGPDPKRPTNAALRKAFENNAHSVVEVVGPRRSGAGVVVSRNGHVLTSVDHVSLEEALVQIDGRAMHARVVMASAALKAAVVVVDPPGPAVATPDGATSPDGGAQGPSPPVLRPPAVRMDETFREGVELVAIERTARGQLQPRLTSVTRGRKVASPFVDVDVPLPNGTPLFDGQGRLVAIAVQRRRSGSRALPLPEVKVLLEQAEVR